MDAQSSSRPNKRQREDVSDADHDPKNGDICPQDLKPFYCSQKTKDIDPSRIVDYFPDLPNTTQYFDMGKLVTASLHLKPYYAEYLVIWRTVSIHTV